MPTSWRKKTKDVKVVVPKEDHDRLTSSMDELVERMNEIADRIEEQLTPDGPQHL